MLLLLLILFPKVVLKREGKQRVAVLLLVDVCVRARERERERDNGGNRIEGLLQNSSSGRCDIFYRSTVSKGVKVEGSL